MLRLNRLPVRSLRLFCCSLLLLPTFGLKAQYPPYYFEGSVVNIGLNAAFGTHFKRIGIKASYSYVYGHFQANTEARAYFSFRSPGPRAKYPELVLSQGFVGSFGNEAAANRFFSSVSNQTAYNNSIGYSYNLYFNTIGTTQQTGIISVQVASFNLITENDILARPTLDRFRTAAMLLQYTFEERIQAGVACVLWTGQMGHKREINNPHFSAGCYMDSTGGRHTQVSHGLLSAYGKYDAGYGQTVQLNAGIDAEEVRNVIQNKLMHDMLLGKKTMQRKPNCHILMLDQNGGPFLYLEGQQIRRKKMFLNLFSNPNIFY
jgi:hypothetical protein